MSLIVAAHNQTDIVICCESLSTYRTLAGQEFVPNQGVEKVHQINPDLALMITGIYSGDTIQFIKDYEYAVSTVIDLEEAFQKLFTRNKARKSTSLHPTEGFKIGLAGYIAGSPTFRFVTREYGDPDVGYVESYPLNYYLSGIREPVELAQRLLNENNIAAQPSTADIESLLKRIVTECVRRYSQKLGEPVQTVVLSKG